MIKNTNNILKTIILTYYSIEKRQKDKIFAKKNIFNL